MIHIQCKISILAVLVSLVKESVAKIVDGEWKIVESGEYVHITNVILSCLLQINNHIHKSLRKEKLTPNFIVLLRDVAVYLHEYYATVSNTVFLPFLHLGSPVNDIFTFQPVREKH